MPPGSRAYLPTEDPFTGKAWALEATDGAFHGPWSRLSATERGHLLWKYLHTKAVWISTDLDVPNPFVRR